MSPFDIQRFFNFPTRINRRLVAVGINDLEVGIGYAKVA